MSRTLKGTRIRGLPPKVLLSRRQDATGSFPTVWRTASDNRTGHYNVFFNDDKVLLFNQKITDAGVEVSTPSFTSGEYKEEQITLGSDQTTYTVTFPGSAFSVAPVITISEIESPNSTENINAFVSDVTTTGFKVKFSSEFGVGGGSFVYRAIVNSPAGAVHYVLRAPRYPTQYTKVVVGQTTVNNAENFSSTHSSFTTTPNSNFITFYDYLNNNEADVYPTSIVATSTDVNVAISALVPDQIKANYMGLSDGVYPPGSTATVKGIVYPLVMTHQAARADLSSADYVDLYKEPVVVNGELTNLPIITTGSMVKNVSDTFVTFTPGQYIQAFKDVGNAAVDGKKSVADPFYATGSIPITFDGPLWSKSKIEFDITPATIQSKRVLKTSKFSDGPMQYWNNVTKTYDSFDSDTDGMQEGGFDDINFLKYVLNNYHVGFGYSMDDGNPETGLKGNAYNARGRQISNFGFPFDTKYEPTKEQTISLENYISEPFLLEKIVVYVNATLDIGPDVGGSGASASTHADWTFFVMNQRSVFPQISDPQTFVGSNSLAIIEFTTSSLIGNNIRDVVDYMQISVNKKTNSSPYAVRECNVIREPTDRYITNQFIISSSIKSSFEFSKGVRSVYFTVVPTKLDAFIEKNENSGRDGLNVNFKNGRDWVSRYGANTTIGTGSYGFPATTTSPEYSFDIKADYAKTPNPYLLFPTDKLVFGWQLPLDMDGVSEGTAMTFYTSGINKVVFYGSLLRVNKDNMLEEYHDTLNQLVSSEAIHEVIG
jgi:hypothetical protein